MSQNLSSAAVVIGALRVKYGSHFIHYTRAIYADFVEDIIGSICPKLFGIGASGSANVVYRLFYY